ncbi:hypothetical protein DH2020_041005 [Rehmannia glutinosa]|uniref:Reverse transcriptase zinc-binding domain-containing protein n=1 Tax=Rehmannia glutinosa TaxID=99300 RepID=A0ABR0UTG4_REHGL
MSSLNMTLRKSKLNTYELCIFIRHSTETTTSWVRDLIIPELGVWDENLLNLLFNPVDVRAIRSIPLCTNRRKDKLVWHHSKDGKYTVKSGYKVAKVLKDDETRSPASSGNNSNLWCWLWALSIPNKVKIFLWRCFHGILPTKEALMRKGVQIDGLCTRCGLGLETNEHVVRDCKWMEIW